MKLLALLALAACHSSPAPSTWSAELVHSASGGYGVQPIGEDKGVLYAFVRLQSDHAMKVSLSDFSLVRDGVTCARPTKAVAIAKIAPLTKDTAYSALRLDELAKGTPYDGTVPPGTTFLRLRVEVDHMCGGAGEPIVQVKLDNGTVLAQPLVERMPS